jgi:hypothetical protein
MILSQICLKNRFLTIIAIPSLIFCVRHCPGRAYDVIEKFDELGESTKDGVCSLRKDLHKMDTRYDHTSTNVVQQEEDSETES